MEIKVCGMRQPENIEKVVRLKPNYVGFIFYPKSKRFVGDMDTSMVNNGLFKKVQKVGVFVNATIKEVVQTAIKYELNKIQLHGIETPEICSELMELEFPVWKAFSIDSEFDFSILEEYEGKVEAFIFDTKVGDQVGGTGKQFDWEILQNYALNTPFYLSGGIGPGDAESILKLKHKALIGVDINSKFEDEPALKNIQKLEGFIKKIREYNDK